MAKKKVDFKPDNSFYQLADEVTRAIKNNKNDNTEQKEQVELLMKLEQDFKKSVLKYPRQCREIYKRFILMVIVDNKNILSARPYFREKSAVFSKSITPAIRDGDYETLKKFHINFLLIDFIKQNWKGAFPERCQDLYDQTKTARQKLIENNMPLAINRAKLFYRKVPQSHLSMMDVIGIAAMGLVSGVDKWVGPYSHIFRSVCIGRMTGNMTDAYSETTLHFYPSDKHVLYRANSLRYRYQIEDLHTLTQALNESFKEDKKTGKKMQKNEMQADELASLMGAASILSTDMPYGDDENGPSIGDMWLKQEDDRYLDEAVEQKDAWIKVLEQLEDLSLLQQKVFKMKGIRL